MEADRKAGAKRERTDRLLASTGRWSRREGKLLIRQGRVRADGICVRSGEEKFDPETTILTVDGIPLTLRRETWIMMNKPAGVLSATEDRRQRTVLDLLPPELQRTGLFPVGRLDVDTTGLLLLTDNGALAHALLSPRQHVDKVYRATVAGRLSERDRQMFREGQVLPDGFHCLPADLEILETREHPAERSGGAPDTVSTVLVTVHEGKFHQVKRMLAACGTPVLQLHRVKLGNLTLDPALEPGEFRFLTAAEVELCRQIQPKSEKEGG